MDCDGKKAFWFCDLKMGRALYISEFNEIKEGDVDQAYAVRPAMWIDIGDI